MIKKLTGILVAAGVAIGVAACDPAQLTDKVAEIQAKVVDVCGFRPDNASVLDVLAVLGDDVKVTGSVVLSVAEGICAAVEGYEPPATPEGTFASPAGGDVKVKVGVGPDRTPVTVTGSFVK